MSQNTRNLRAALAAGAMDGTLTTLYGPEGVAAAHTRYGQLLENFEAAFGTPAAALFSAPGRTELGGNHTDHQRGCVLAAGVNLDMLAAAGPNGENVIRVHSHGFAPEAVLLDNLERPRPEETNGSAALIRGIAVGLRQRGYTLTGVDIYLTSQVPQGSGLSSSAAYEVLVGGVLNGLCCGGAVTALELAQIGQFAENEYFGKPSGLMDQAASAVGGVVAIDFYDPAAPLVRQIPFDLHQAGYALFTIDSGAGHADLTAEYAAITQEMGAVAAFFQKQVLSQVDEGDFYTQLPQVRAAVGDRAILRAMHFFDETRRAREEAQALESGDMEGFLRLVRQSGQSSSLWLQNVTPTGQTARQELAVTLAVCRKILAGRGAVRVHGGGFGGTALAFVPLEQADDFRRRVEDALGAGRCHMLSLRPVGVLQVS